MARHKKSTNAIGSQRFGEWLRNLRETKKLPLRAIAAAAEMDQAHLSKVELGRRVPTAEQAGALARFFCIDANVIEARRIAEKFRLKYADNPAAAQAIHMLSKDHTTYGITK